MGAGGGGAGPAYPALAQSAIRAARTLARNVAAAVEGRAPTPFVDRRLRIVLD